MLFYYNKFEKEIEALNDLIKINNDRIADYQLALDQATYMDLGLKESFKQIITEGTNFRYELTLKMNELKGSGKKKTSTIIGKIYKAWTDLKVTFSYNTQKAIISSCLYNESVALHAYKAALSSNTSMPVEIRQRIEEQAKSLSSIYTMLKKHRDTRYFMNQNLVYFN